MTRRTPAVDLVASAVRDVARATHLLHPTAARTNHDELRDVGWQLTQLTGGLTDLVAELASSLGEHHRQRLLRDEYGGDPARQVARASRGLCELRQALEASQSAARDYFAALSHLVVEVDPTADPRPSPRSASRRNAGR